jgi:hypothetical protein
MSHKYEHKGKSGAGRGDRSGVDLMLNEMSDITTME